MKLLLNSLNEKAFMRENEGKAQGRVQLPPKSVAMLLGTAAAVSYALWPKINDFILNKGFQLFPSSSAAKGVKEPKPTMEQVVFANVFKGEHW